MSDIESLEREIALLTDDIEDAEKQNKTLKAENAALADALDKATKDQYSKLELDLAAGRAGQLADRFECAALKEENAALHERLEDNRTYTFDGKRKDEYAKFLEAELAALQKRLANCYSELP